MLYQCAQWSAKSKPKALEKRHLLEGLVEKVGTSLDSWRKKVLDFRAARLLAITIIKITTKTTTMTT